ncbi:Similar to Ankyrin repeat domain-containing protein 50; acc. no. Q9ULJ7 [Pyronema omphalodes CBS 100304]|uniref:Similar to Ankyrin repeat domain-containing protein 50 acc. no. Q9ULJ7 n=1 Tax=Pyronema omphalodes (strain CBS 100304) TaxID=1076935 RepID=U4L151_PYROM|nr:Similar to Ankyrin repeat domain-containing protein 50; acc. no. Q9ULJ7 [Pyronema omphalodes CBS 100304]
MADRQAFPAEILLEISEYTTTATLASLCATSRQLYALLIPSLYRRGVEIASNEQQMLLNIGVRLIRQNKYSSVAKLLQYGLSACTCTRALRRYVNSSSGHSLTVQDTSLLQISVYVRNKRRTGNTSITKLLLDHGADVHHKDSEGFTALHYAMIDLNSRSGPMGNSWATMLIQHGADVNAVSRWGRSPLHTAALYNNWVAIGHLVGYGASINTVDSDGRTAVMCAIEINVDNSHAKVIAELYKYGAQAPPSEAGEVSPN